MLFERFGYLGKGVVNFPHFLVRSLEVSMGKNCEACRFWNNGVATFLMAFA